MLLQANKDLVGRYYEEILNQKRLEIIPDLFNPDFLSHAPGVVTVNLEQYRQAIRQSHAAFPDLKVKLDDQIAEGEKVVTRWTAHATHLGPFMGLPPTNKPLTVTAIHIHRVQGGKLIEHWEEINLLGVLKQLGFK